VLWLDAHGDLNRPETSRAGTSTGCRSRRRSASPGRRSRASVYRCRRSSRPVALVGVRSLDPASASCSRELDACVFTMSDVDRHGRRGGDGRALERRRGRFVHLSLDMDVARPEVAPGVGTPVRGGLSYREAHLAMELARRRAGSARSRSSR
jgi:arginase